MKHCEHCIMQDCDWCHEMPKGPQKVGPAPHQLRNISSGEDAFINTVNNYDYTRTTETLQVVC
jgi:cytochrome c2